MSTHLSSLGRFDTIPTPLAAQPGAYIAQTYKDKRYGQLGPVEALGGVQDDKLSIELRFAVVNTSHFHPSDEPVPGPNFFSGQAGLFFPLQAATTFWTMGSPDAPGELWYWRARPQQSVRLKTSGFGTSEQSGEPPEVSVTQEEGQLSVRFSGRLPSPWLKQFSVALWDGGNQERGGLKAVVPQWIALP